MCILDVYVCDRDLYSYRTELKFHMLYGLFRNTSLLPYYVSHLDSVEVQPTVELFLLIEGTGHSDLR